LAFEVDDAQRKTGPKAGVILIFDNYLPNIILTGCSLKFMLGSL